jgi:UDP-4-amino-4,6-dideoxy-N-acetyl-beta-L-altrosamine transaminase
MLPLSGASRYGCQWLDAEDEAAVLAALRSPFLTQGPRVTAFEQALMASCGAAAAVALCNATAALHLGCLALGIGPGDSVWTSPNTFVASANCARLCGAEVDFVDIDPASFNLCPKQLAAKLAAAKACGKLPKALIVVHFAGRPAEMAAIHPLAKTYGVQVIEDAAHALGAHYPAPGQVTKPVGSHPDTAFTVLSFHPVKMITTGEGGALITQDRALAERVRRLANHGITRNPDDWQQAPSHCATQGPLLGYYEQQALGLNYRLTDLHAALGTSQLRKLGAFLAYRRLLARRYHQLLMGLPLQRPEGPDDGNSSWHLYVVLLPEGIDRQRIMQRLQSQGIGTAIHYWPVCNQPYYRQAYYRQADARAQCPETDSPPCPIAQDYATRCLSLPLHAQLRFADQITIVQALNAALN